MSDNGRPLTPGYRLNSDMVLRDLHRLISTVVAISPIQAHKNKRVNSK